MKLVLINRERLQSLGSFLVDELDSLIGRIKSGWNVEHMPDGSHGHVHALSVATGRLVYSDIAEANLSNALSDNYNPSGLGTASLLRITPASDLATITGIQVPQETDGTVLDGRVLTVENAAAAYTLRLLCEGTTSIARNRVTVPWGPTDGDSSYFHISPRTLLTLIYNATVSRWMIQSQSNEQIVTLATLSTSQNDWAPTGFRAAGVLRVSAASTGLTISGFDSTNVPAPSRKLLRNDGLYTISLLHVNTGSAAGNRIACPGGIRYLLNPREAAMLYREVDGGWRLVASGKADQWVDVTFDATNFTASTGNWTLTSGDQSTLAYQIDGNRMTVSFELETTTVSATPTTLSFKIPAGRTAARNMSSSLAYVLDNSTALDTGRASVTAGGTTINLTKNAAGTAWSAATNTTTVRGQIVFMVIDASATISEVHTDVAHGDTAHSDVEHLDVAHVDVAHSDSHGDTAHTDVSHTDTAHSDTHSDVAHSDTAHVDVAHSDTAHVDVSHQDSTVSHVDHNDVGHADVPSSHNDVAHSDTAHSDTAHSDTAHVDTAHSDTHSDTAHGDFAHVDGGHSDTHSDTVPHADTAHADTAHGDTAHSDAVHSDVGYHTDTTHSDI